MPSSRTTIARRPPAKRPAPERIAATPAVNILRAPALNDLRWLVHGFSTRFGGVSVPPYSSPNQGELNLGKVSWDSAEHVAENRGRFLAALLAREFQLLTLNQVHGDLLRSYGAAAPLAAPARDSLRGDGQISAQPGLLLAILSADCLPILMADTRLRGVAAFHCGWRGTLRRLVQKGIGRMRMLHGSQPADLRVAIGPGIRACCFEVGEEVLHAFESQFTHGKKFFALPPERERPFAERHALMYRNVIKYPLLEKPRKYHLDLVEANVSQLLSAGVKGENIWTDAPCTHCHPRRFFSHRRDALRAGRMMSVIGVRP